jgi:hypothetical protein
LSVCLTSLLQVCHRRQSPEWRTALDNQIWSWGSRPEIEVISFIRCGGVMPQNFNVAQQ